MRDPLSYRVGGWKADALHILKDGFLLPWTGDPIDAWIEHPLFFHIVGTE